MLGFCRIFVLSDSHLSHYHTQNRFHASLADQDFIPQSDFKDDQTLSLYLFILPKDSNWKAIKRDRKITAIFTGAKTCMVSINRVFFIRCSEQRCTSSLATSLALPLICHDFLFYSGTAASLPQVLFATSLPRFYGTSLALPLVCHIF